MHVPYFYKLFYEYHHYYKSPEPWDDMFIHPIEAFGYYCILYSPPFLFQCHIYAFVVYMMIMGICGILDHSGIHFSFRRSRKERNDQYFLLKKQFILKN